MPIREFTDQAGVTWRAWETLPDRTDVLAPDYRAGWLTFESERERRRLTPVPSDWASLAVERLRMLVRVAEPSARGDSARPALAVERRRAERRRAERRRRERRRSAGRSGLAAAGGPGGAGTR